jgi:GNAT superfamily N-acetyltransferase
VAPDLAGNGLTVTLRPSVRGDLAAVDALLARSYPRLLAADYPPSVLVTAVPLIARARPDLLASGTYWVAVEGAGAIVGAGGWSVAGQGSGEVRHVVTDARRQRQGIGRLVMRAAMGQAGAAGIVRLDCLSTRSAVPFYAALGFRAIGPVEVPLRPGIVFPAVRMLCDLAPP